MARKALLTEQEIRRFLKLANVDAINNQRLEEIGFTESALEEQLPPEEEEEELGMDVDMGPPGGEDEMAMDVGVEDEPDVGGEMDEELEDMLAKGVEALAAAWGIEDRVDVEGGEEGAEDLEDLEEPVPGEEEMPMDMDIEGGPEGLDVSAEEEEEVPVPGMRYEENEMVQEVARRVVARLSKHQKQTELSDRLAERILKRLTSKST